MVDLAGKIPGKYLVQALDDDRDGMADPAVVTALQKTVADDINARVGQRYKTPFQNPLPAVVAHAAIVIACYEVYKRRGVEDKANPHAGDARDIRAKLDLIGQGKEPLDASRPTAQPGAIIAGAPAKTVPQSGKTLA